MTDEEIRLLQGDQPNIITVFRAEVGGEVIRLFAGFGDFPIPAGGLETEDSVYTCVGRWGGELPAIDWLMNGQAQGLELQLPGVDVETASSYLYERELIIGAPAGFGWGVLDERLKLAGPIHWSLRGFLSKPVLRRVRSAPNVWTRTLGVTLVAGAVRRRRPDHSYFTGPDQRRRSEDDAFCDRAALYNMRSTRPWPN